MLYIMHTHTQRVRAFHTEIFLLNIYSLKLCDISLNITNCLVSQPIILYIEELAEIPLCIKYITRLRNVKIHAFIYRVFHP